MKIVVLDGYTLNPGDLDWKGLEALGECTVYDRTSLTDIEEVIERIEDADIVYTNKTPLPEIFFEKCKNLKFVGVLATGYNVVDIAAAKKKNIPVANIPTYGTAAVGQFAIALLLEICHHIGHHSKVVHEGKWAENPDWCFWDYPLIELDGKTMGIIGYGRIGQATGKIAQALGMKVLAYDSKSTIAKMKDGVIILNNSRGQLIEEEDLADALNSGKVMAAGLDVVSTEPIKNNNPLLFAKNCLITPHISWASKESRKRLMDIAVSNLQEFLNGTPKNIVN